MLTYVRSGLVLTVAVGLAVGIAALPTWAADQSKGLKARVGILERGLTVTQAELLVVHEALAASTSDVETLHSNLADIQAELGDAMVNVQALKDKLEYMTLVQGDLNGLAGPHIIFEGCNVHVRSGSGDTTDGTLILFSQTPIPDTAPLGLGNLIVGYNEQPQYLEGPGRGGSHNLIVGAGHSYPDVGTVVFGQENQATGPFASVSGGQRNEAQGYASSVTGGLNNNAQGDESSVTGGLFNWALGDHASVSGGGFCQAQGESSSVSGGSSRFTFYMDDWAAGDLYEDH